MSIVAENYQYVIGVDTHAKTHTYAVIAATTGAVVDTATFPTTAAGMPRAITWIGRRTTGEYLAAVEGTRSYYATITRAFSAAAHHRHWPGRAHTPDQRAGGTSHYCPHPHEHRPEHKGLPRASHQRTQNSTRDPALPQMLHHP